MHSLGVFFSKLTGITAKSNGMVVSVKALTFDGILRGRRLLVVFYGSRDLSMLHNQFSLYSFSDVALFLCYHLPFFNCRVMVDFVRLHI